MAENDPDRVLKKDEYLEIKRRMNAGEPIPDDMKVRPERLEQAEKSFGKVKKPKKPKGVGRLGLTVPDATPSFMDDPDASRKVPTTKTVAVRPATTVLIDVDAVAEIVQQMAKRGENFNNRGILEAIDKLNEADVDAFWERYPHLYEGNRSDFNPDLAKQVREQISVDPSAAERPEGTITERKYDPRYPDRTKEITRKVSKVDRTRFLKPTSAQNSNLARAVAQFLYTNGLLVIGDQKGATKPTPAVKGYGYLSLPQADISATFPSDYKASPLLLSHIKDKDVPRKEIGGIVKNILTGNVEKIQKDPTALIKEAEYQHRGTTERVQGLTKEPVPTEGEKKRGRPAAGRGVVPVDETGEVLDKRGYAGEPVDPRTPKPKNIPKTITVSQAAKEAFVESHNKAIMNYMATDPNKRNYFKQVLEETLNRNKLYKNILDQQVSQNEIKVIKDYLFDNGFLKADPNARKAQTYSTIRDGKVPYYLVPTNKMLKDDGAEFKKVMSKLNTISGKTIPTAQSESAAERTRRKMPRVRFRTGVPWIDGAIATGVGIYTYMQGGDAKAAVTEGIRAVIDPSSPTAKSGIDEILNLEGKTPQERQALRRAYDESIARKEEAWFKAKELEDKYGVVLERGQTLSDVLTPSEIERAKSANSFLNLK